MINVENWLKKDVRDPIYDTDQYKAKEKAESEGFQVVYTHELANPNLNRLLLDIDNQVTFDELPQRLSCVNKAFPIKDVLWKRSKSGNYHVMVFMDSKVYFDKKEKFLIEVCLGSDWKRGIYNLKNFHDNSISGMLFTVKETCWNTLAFGDK